VEAPSRAPYGEDDYRRGLKPPWPKGVSGNPSGKPKGTRTRVGRLLERQLDERDEDGITVRQHIVAEYLRKAMGGNEKILLDFMKRQAGDPEGPPIQITIGSEASEVHVIEEDRASQAISVLYEVIGPDDDAA